MVFCSIGNLLDGSSINILPNYNEAANLHPWSMALLASNSSAISAPPIIWILFPDDSKAVYNSLRGVCPAQIITLSTSRIFDSSPLESSGKSIHIIGGADIADELDAKRAIDQGCRLAASL